MIPQIRSQSSQTPLKGLAEKLGLDPQALKKTLDDYNGAINDKEFDLMKLDGKATTGLSLQTRPIGPIPSAKPPYYGYPMKAQLTL